MNWFRSEVVTVKRVAIAVLIVGGLLLLRLLPTDELRNTLQTWLDDLGFWGPVVFVGLYIVATICFLPGSILTLVAGAIFGLGLGLAVVSIGSTIGAACALLIARYLARAKVEQLAETYPTFQAVDEAISEAGWKVVAMLRLSPAIPFNVQNYLYGLTNIKFWPCVLTSWIAMLPGTFLYVYIGHIADSAVAGEEKPVGQWILLGVGLIATIAVTVYITRLARQKLKSRNREL
ncbi:TVP38/TMEM64 family protein [Thalassoroseus pseudoceratinae]|uniref:TVP38/TMEM64 family protein n=1 Tax=Thalassoroseus pseudoceratinae TaxID=2713176 RepID=UPI00141DD6FB|nr:TVP38/TMEM64 family protein [Thalassoroseus pseudoceratinae]